VKSERGGRQLPSGVEIRARVSPAEDGLLTADAVAFVADLTRKFGARVDELLAQRKARGVRMARGEEAIDFLAETSAVREGAWTVAKPPSDLLDRRVEITGPVDRKMIINALNSGANVFMADFEDSNSPTWDNLIQGQANLVDAIRRTITFEAPASAAGLPGKSYKLNEKTAALFVRPRGFHLYERHMTVDGVAVPGALFDFGLYFFLNAKELIARGTAPYFYLPKMESHLEARLWNDVFVHAQASLGVPRGTIRATCLIETLPAAFEMDEILYELREHSAGLNCGRWDYIFSYIKKRAHDPAALLPDRGQVTMDKAFLRAYSLLLIKTCHRRGIHAMGGMAAQIPIKDDPEANDAAMAKVRADKLREVTDGHDGTWVAHPALVGVAREIFDLHMKRANQIEKTRDDVTITTREMLEPHQGTRTEAGLRHNIRVGVQYIEAWLRGNGCVPIYNLMEDAATAEISRAQVWQWLHHKVALDGGGGGGGESERATLTKARFLTIVGEEMQKVRAELGDARFDASSGSRFAEARDLFERLSTAEAFDDFLTLSAYDALLADELAANLR
jgi:malate synthase